MSKEKAEKLLSEMSMEELRTQRDENREIATKNKQRCLLTWAVLSLVIYANAYDRELSPLFSIIIALVPSGFFLVLWRTLIVPYSTKADDANNEMVDRLKPHTQP